MLSIAFPRGFIGVIAAVLLFALPAPLQAKDFIKGERPQQRGYSQAVITDGGKIVWLAGVLAVVDDSGKSLAGDLDGQVRQIFKLLNATLEKAGGKLSDMEYCPLVRPSGRSASSNRRASTRAARCR